jgi:hypothetical protein
MRQKVKMQRRVQGHWLHVGNCGYMSDPTDGGGLLPGEFTPTDAASLEELNLWVEVYAELHEFKEVLLEAVADQRRRVRVEGQAEIDNDEKLLRKEAARVKRRLEFWRAELKKRR